MTPPRPHGRVPQGLSADEAALWRKVTETVTPLHRPHFAKPPSAANPAPSLSPPVPVSMAEALQPRPPRGRIPPPRPAPTPPPAPPRPLSAQGLDGSWDRKLARGIVEPDVTIDLHGMNLDTAHARLGAGLTQALAMGARVILLIAGKPRPVDEHDLRGQRRGAIRAKLLDWLAHSSHASRIAAVRGAHPRHGGAGAVYIVLRKAR
ncbi:Smr/MutS family protein [Novosphingobium sp. FKTRR1]|uniref:Smr/MutS family protein n=1 Tax=unclassified Novosphingobium TaxID=2644732 RepID=UPI001CF06DDB|nr:Smr/MutS family protein [Novosphingobium sp. FKTRR1]